MEIISAFISTSSSTSFIFHLCQFVPFLFNPIPFLVFLFFNFCTSCCFSYLLLFPLLSNSTLFLFFLIYLNSFCCLSPSFIYSFSSIFKCIIVNIFQFIHDQFFYLLIFFFKPILNSFTMRNGHEPIQNFLVYLRWLSL